MTDENNSGKGRKSVPRIPKDFNPSLQKAGDLIGDLTIKLSSLGQKFDGVFKLKIDTSDIEDFSKKIGTSNKLLNLLAKGNSNVEKNLKKLASTHKDINGKVKEGNKFIEQQKKLVRDLREQYKLGKITDIEKKSRTEDINEAIRESIKQIRELRSGQEKLDSATKTVAKTLANDMLSALDHLADTAIFAVIDLTVLSLEKMKDGFLKIYDLLERTTKAVGTFNLSMGATTSGLDATRQKAWELEGQMRALTGGGLGIGLEMFAETSHALGFIGGDFDEIAKKSTIAGRALGIGGAAAGELSRAFSQMGDTSKDTYSNFVKISDAANDAGVSVADFGKEIVSSKGFMTSFGKSGQKVFLNMAAYAKKLGVSIASMAKFTDMTDTFSSSAEAAAKMNAVFGTTINSLQMMLEQDPSKRLEMVRKQFKQQGKSWETMSRQEKLFFSQTMQLTEEEAAGVLNSGMTLDKFRKKQEQRKKQQVSDEDQIRRALLKTSQTLMNWGQVFDDITRAAMGMFKPLLKTFGLVSDGKEDFRSLSELVGKAKGKIKEFFDRLASNPKVMEMMTTISGTFDQIFAAFLSDGPEANKSMDRLVDSAADFAVGLKGILVTVKDVFEKVLTRQNIDAAILFAGTLAKNMPEILETFVVLKSILGAVSVLQGLASIVTLLGGAAKIWSAITSAISTLGPILATVGEGFATVGAIIAEMGAAGVIFSGMIGVAVGSLLRLIPGVDSATEGLISWTSKLLDSDVDKKIEENSGTYLMAIQKAQAAEKSGKGVDSSTKAILDELRGNKELSRKMADRLEKSGTMEAALVKTVIDESKNVVGMSVAELRAQSQGTQTPTPAAVATPTAPKPAEVTFQKSPESVMSSNTGLTRQEQRYAQEIKLISSDVYLDSEKVGKVLLKRAATT